MAITEAIAWREAAVRAETEELQARAMERHDEKLLEAVRLLPPEVSAPSPVKPMAGKPAKRLVERRMVEQRSLLTGEIVLSEPRQRRG